MTDNRYAALLCPFIEKDTSSKPYTVYFSLTALLCAADVLISHVIRNLFGSSFEYVEAAVCVNFFITVFSVISDIASGKKAHKYETYRFLSRRIIFLIFSLSLIFLTVVFSNTTNIPQEYFIASLLFAAFCRSFENGKRRGKKANFAKRKKRDKSITAFLLFVLSLLSLAWLTIAIEVCNVDTSGITHILQKSVCDMFPAATSTVFNFKEVIG